MASCFGLFSYVYIFLFALFSTTALAQYNRSPEINPSDGYVRFYEGDNAIWGLLMKQFPYGAPYGQHVTSIKVSARSGFNDVWHNIPQVGLEMPFDVASGWIYGQNVTAPSAGYANSQSQAPPTMSNSSGLFARQLAPAAPSSASPLTQLSPAPPSFTSIPNDQIGQSPQSAQMSPSTAQADPDSSQSPPPMIEEQPEVQSDPILVRALVIAFDVYENCSLQKGVVETSPNQLATAENLFAKNDNWLLAHGRRWPNASNQSMILTDEAAGSCADAATQAASKFFASVLAPSVAKRVPLPPPKVWDESGMEGRKYWPTYQATVQKIMDDVSGARANALQVNPARGRSIWAKQGLGPLEELKSKSSTLMTALIDKIDRLRPLETDSEKALLAREKDTISYFYREQVLKLINEAEAMNDDLDKRAKAAVREATNIRTAQRGMPSNQMTPAEDPGTSRGPSAGPVYDPDSDTSDANQRAIDELHRANRRAALTSELTPILEDEANEAKEQVKILAARREDAVEESVKAQQSVRKAARTGRVAEAARKWEQTARDNLIGAERRTAEAARNAVLQQDLSLQARLENNIAKAQVLEKERAAIPVQITGIENELGGSLPEPESLPKGSLGRNMAERVRSLQSLDRELDQAQAQFVQSLTSARIAKNARNLQQVRRILTQRMAERDAESQEAAELPNEDFQNEINRLKELHAEEINAYRKSIVEAEDMAKAMKAHVQSNTAKIEQFDTMIGDLTRQIREQRTDDMRNTEDREELQRAQDEAEDSKTRAKKLQEDIEQHKSKNAQLEQEIAEANGKNRGLKQQIAKAQEDLQNARAESQSSAFRVSRLHEQINELNEQIEGLSRDFSQNEKALDSLRDEKARLEDAVSKGDPHSDTLRAQLDERTRQIRVLSEKHDKQVQQLEEAKEAQARAASEEKQAKSLHSQKARDASRLKSRLTDLSKQNSGLTAKNSELKDQVTRGEEETRALQSQLADVEEAARTHDAKVQGLSQLTDDQQEKIQTLTAERDRERAQKAELEMELDDLKKGMNEQAQKIRANNAQIRRLRKSRTSRPPQRRPAKPPGDQPLQESPTDSEAEAEPDGQMRDPVAELDSSTSELVQQVYEPLPELDTLDTVMSNALQSGAGAAAAAVDSTSAFEATESTLTGIGALYANYGWIARANGWRLVPYYSDIRTVYLWTRYLVNGGTFQAAAKAMGAGRIAVTGAEAAHSGAQIAKVGAEAVEAGAEEATTGAGVAEGAEAAETASQAAADARLVESAGEGTRAGSALATGLEASMETLEQTSAAILAPTGIGEVIWLAIDIELMIITSLLGPILHAINDPRKELGPLRDFWMDLNGDGMLEKISYAHEQYKAKYVPDNDLLTHYNAHIDSYYETTQLEYWDEVLGKTSIKWSGDAVGTPAYGYAIINVLKSTGTGSTSLAGAIDPASGAPLAVEQPPTGKARRGSTDPREVLLLKAQMIWDMLHLPNLADNKLKSKITVIADFNSDGEPGETTVSFADGGGGRGLLKMEGNLIIDSDTDSRERIAIRDRETVEQLSYDGWCCGSGCDNGSSC